MKKKTAIIGAGLLAAAAALTGCASDAEKASHNLSTAADNFEVQRRIIGVNGITGKAEFDVEGRCSIQPDPAEAQLEVTCKHGPDDYRKHYLGMSDNLFYVVTQLDAVDVSTYHTRIILKPQNILPNFDLQTGEQL